MSWIIIISVIVIAGLVYWMMSGKKEESEVSEIPASPVEEPAEEEPAEKEPAEESSEEDKPAM